MGLGRKEFPDQQRMRMKMAYGNRVYLGGKDMDYTDAPFDDQISRTGWSWGSSALDVDNEGWMDLYISNGHMSRKSAKDYCTRFWTQDIYQGTSQRSEEMLNVFQTEDKELAGGGISWNGFEHKALLKNDHGKGFPRCRLSHEPGLSNSMAGKSSLRTSMAMVCPMCSSSNQNLLS